MCKESKRIPEPPEGPEGEQLESVRGFVEGYGSKFLPVDLWDGEDASRAVAAMDTMYREVVAVDTDQMIGPLVREFQKGVTTEMIAKICTTEREAMVSSDVSATVTLQVIQDFGEVYTRLIEQHDSDGWLKEFLETNAEFTGSIGGIPEWMQQSQSSS